MYKFKEFKEPEILTNHLNLIRVSKVDTGFPFSEQM